MRYILISYDLKQPERNYSELYDAIKSLGEWKHPMESVWVVKLETDIKLNQIRERLREKMDDNDSIFVVDVTNSPYSGWMSSSFWKWFRVEG